MFWKKDKKSGSPAPASGTAGATVESPYLAARREWLERYGDYIQAAAQWRLAAVLALVLLLFSLGTNIFQLQQNKITPYIVEVDKLGAAAAVRPLREQGEVPHRLIQSEIAGVITRWRTVTADIDLQKKLVQRLAAYTGGSAKGTLREWFEANNPYERAQKVLVSVDILGMPLPVSKDSWRVTWLETVRNHGGVTLETIKYEATLSVLVVPPKDEASIIANPGGVLITGISFSKLLNQ